MKSLLRETSIRTRLLVVYVGILLVGFAGLALVTGNHISSSADVDYAQRMRNEIVLIAQAIAETAQEVGGQRNDDRLQQLLASYESEIGGMLTYFSVPGDPHAPDRDSSFRDRLELETALRGQIITVQRENQAGEATLYTAAPVLDDQQLQGLLQLAVPASNLRRLIAERWGELGSLFALVTAAAVGTAFWLARSIIRPLDTLRESAVRLSEGDFSHRVAYDGRDEIGAVARAFNEMARQVETMLEEQRAFASNTSHELRTPLTTIRLRTEALRFDPTLDAAIAKDYITEIDDEVVRLGDLVQDLTLLSRFDAGRAELGQDQVDVGRFAASLCQQLAEVAEARGSHISLTGSETSVVVHASINHLTVVFRNLLDNAIKYTPSGGVILWNLEAVDGGVRNTIRDPGQGVDMAHLPRLFERFYRADKARSRETPGTGLGLALVKSIVEAYGGRVTIDSDGVGKGTTVTVFWPERPLSSSGRGTTET